MGDIREYIAQYQNLVEYFIIQNNITGEEFKVYSEDAEFIRPDILDREVEYCQKGWSNEYCILYFV